MSETKEVLLFDDPKLVEYRTDLEGWTGPDRLYYGKGEEGEKRARYANSTHRKCECGNLMGKFRIRCNDCQNKSSDEIFLKLEEVEWDGKSMMSARHDDMFFSDMDDVHDYCESSQLPIHAKAMNGLAMPIRP